MKKVITIDGPSGVGKTTIGQEIALNLNYSFFSSGKLYRYISKYSYDVKTSNYDEINLVIDISGNCLINNISYSDDELYNKNINNHSSEIARDPLVRELVKNTLEEIYLDADENIRGERREHQSGSEETIEEIKQRDHKDMHREESPLVIPENAVVIDNTNKTKEETVKEIIEKLKL